MTQHISVMLALFFSAITLRADLVLEQQFGDTNVVGHFILKLHGNKMRLDQQDTRSNDFSVIIDLNTRDSYTLVPQTKSYRTRSGATIRQEMAAATTADATNDMNLPPTRPVATGKAEKVDGYDTEIYTWSGAHGVSETLWVATNFPHYDSIRNELAKLDQFNTTGPHKNAQPELSPLSGMVIKARTTANGKKAIITLVSVKEEPVDASLFELPADYVPWQPPVMQATNPVTPPDKSP